MSTRKQIRVLHIIGGMNRGGAETLLMHVLRNINREQFHLDFLVHTPEQCSYDEEILTLGSKIMPCLEASNPWKYAKYFKQIIKKNEPYDVIHSHVHHYSSLLLYMAKSAGIPIRIAHSHNDTRVLQTKASPIRRFYLDTATKLIRRYATHGLAVSSDSATDLFGSGWELDKRWMVFRFGIDFSSFAVDTDSNAVRSELGIPKDAFVIGHVGRFDEQKNHAFLVDIMAELAKSEPNIYMLLMGDGLLKPTIEQKIRDAGLADRTIFTGSRPDVSRLMMGAMDVFVFPSIYEGLPVVLMETQAAGIPCVMSDIVTKEVDMVKPLMHRLSLNNPAAQWAEAIIHAKKSSVPQQDALAIVMNSPFNIQNSIKELEKLYKGGSYA